MKQNLELAGKPPDPSHPDWNAFSILLTKSELIGAEVRVIKSKIPSQVGMSGTIVLETKMTILFVTSQNELKCKYCFIITSSYIPGVFQMLKKDKKIKFDLSVYDVYLDL